MAVSFGANSSSRSKLTTINARKIPCANIPPRTRFRSLDRGTLIIAAIHIVPDDNFEDWVVRDGNGCELGHFSTRDSAELLARPLAQKLRGELVVHLPDGRTERKSFA
jgi:hypothetical protein